MRKVHSGAGPELEHVSRGVSEQPLPDLTQASLLARARTAVVHRCECGLAEAHQRSLRNHIGALVAFPPWLGWVAIPLAVLAVTPIGRSCDHVHQEVAG